MRVYSNHPHLHLYLCLYLYLCRYLHLCVCVYVVIVCVCGYIQGRDIPHSPLTRSWTHTLSHHLM